MIKKLPEIQIHSCAKINEKLNEVIDAVNALIYKNNEDSDWYDDPKHKEQPTDLYAEQRKWIGKLCKFWDDEDEGYIYEILIDIDGSDYPYKIVDVDSKNWTMSYKHCEPVSEDLIYKGGDNE